MRILFLTFYYPPDLCAGSFRAFSIVQALLEKAPESLEIEVLTTTPNRYKSVKTFQNKNNNVARLKITNIPISDHNSRMLDQSISFFWFAAGVLKRTKKKRWDMIIATSARLMTGALATFISKRHGIPLYLDIRDLFTLNFQDISKGKFYNFLNPVFYALEKWTLNNASKINLISQGFLTHANKIRPGFHYTTFPNGLDKEFQNLKFSTSKRGKKCPLILYAGNIGEGQGLHKIIPSIGKILQGKAEFLIIGDGGCKKKLQEKIKKSQLRNVKIMPPVPREDLIGHYFKADILFIHLNSYESLERVLPSKVFEYAATNKPILAGVSGYTKAFIEAEMTATEIFQPCDESSFLDALEKISSIAEPINREVFCKKFERAKITKDMAKDILSLIS